MRAQFFFRFVTNQAFDRQMDGQTDEQTDRIFIARTKTKFETLKLKIGVFIM